VTTGGPEAGERRYALELDEREVERYRLMAEQACDTKVRAVSGCVDRRIG
jgi:hypothetical protein